MRASDRRFGVSSPEHDVACRYLATRAQELVDRLVAADVVPPWRLGVTQCDVEHEIDGATIAYLDLFVEWRAMIAAHFMRDAEMRIVPVVARGELVIEVKTAPVALGDAVRQIRLYRRLLRARDFGVFDRPGWIKPDRLFVLAHCGTLAADERRILASHAIAALPLPTVHEMGERLLAGAAR